MLSPTTGLRAGPAPLTLVSFAGSESTVMRKLLLAGISIGVVAVLAVAGLVAYHRYYGARMADWLASAATPPTASVREWASVMEVARGHHQPPPANAGDEQIAAVALQRLLWTAEGAGLTAPAAPIAEAWDFAQFEGNPLGLVPGQWHQLLSRAGELTPEQIEYVRSLESHPAARAFSEFAAARSVDVMGARYRQDVPRGGLNSLLADPVLEYRRLSFAAGLWFARSAVALQEGHSTDAERLAREVLNAALLLWDESGSLVDAMYGRVLAERALIALGEIYRATGRAPAATALNELLERARATPRNPLFPSDLNAERLFRTLEETAARADVPLGLKVDLAASAQTVGYVRWCHLLPAPMEDESWRRQIAERAARRSSQQRRIEWVLRLPESRQGCNAGEPPAAGDAGPAIPSDG